MMRQHRLENRLEEDSPRDDQEDELFDFYFDFGPRRNILGCRDFTTSSLDEADGRADNSSSNLICTGSDFWSPFG